MEVSRAIAQKIAIIYNSCNQQYAVVMFNMQCFIICLCIMIIAHLLYHDMIIITIYIPSLCEQYINIGDTCSTEALNYSTICIPVRGQIKETARVDNLVIPQCARWITSYLPVVNGYVLQTQSFKAWR